MKNIREVRDSIVGAAVGLGMGGEALSRLVDDLETEKVRAELTQESKDLVAREGLADLELSFEDVGWRDLTTYYGLFKFNRATMKRVVALSRVMYIVNPLIKRAVTVQELYVWGSGCTIKAEDKLVEEVLNDFFDDPSNDRVIGQGEEGWPQREREQRIDGNTFFAFFTNRRTGAVRVRLIPYDIIEDVIYNPQDSKEVWFYRRSTANLTGAAIDGDVSGTLSTIPDSPGSQILYPDIAFDPINKLSTFGVERLPIDWNVKVMHIKTGGLSSMKFGLPELYAGLNWATAYKRILENFATILAAYARLAMKMTGLAGKKGVAAAKSKLNTAITSDQFRDTNAPANTASWMALSGNVDVQPVKTAHSTTAPDEARALRSMVASAADLPEHFFGDSEVGNFATSETLDRPTELKMIARQQMWRQIILRMSRFVIQSSALAISGKLRNDGFKGEKTLDPFSGTNHRVTVTPPEKRSLAVEVTFPNITERAVADRVRAVTMAATLNGRPAEGIFKSRKFLFKLMLEALGVRDADRLTDKYYPDDIEQGFKDPTEDVKNSKIEADAKKKLGEAAMIAATARKTVAEKPTPAPVAAPKKKKKTGA